MKGAGKRKWTDQKGAREKVRKKGEGEREENYGGWWGSKSVSDPVSLLLWDCIAVLQDHVSSYLLLILYYCINLYLTDFKDSIILKKKNNNNNPFL